jgi:hypothetical protein
MPSHALALSGAAMGFLIAGSWHWRADRKAKESRVGLERT